MRKNDFQMWLTINWTCSSCFVMFCFVLFWLTQGNRSVPDSLLCVLVERFRVIVTVRLSGTPPSFHRTLPLFAPFLHWLMHSAHWLLASTDAVVSLKKKKKVPSSLCHPQAQCDHGAGLVHCSVCRAMTDDHNAPTNPPPRQRDLNIPVLSRCTERVLISHDCVAFTSFARRVRLPV